MIASAWPSQLDDIWAKSPLHPDQGQGERLAEHTWNVLEKLAELTHLRPDLPDVLGVPQLWNRLFWACWLHDFGKAAQGFQSMLRGGEPWAHRHEVLSLAFLDWITDGLSEEDCRWIAAGIVAHHRDPSEIRIRYSGLWLLDDNPIIKPLAEISASVVDGLWHWLKEHSALWVSQLGFDSEQVQVPVLPSHPNATLDLRNHGADRAKYWLKSCARFVDSLARADNGPLILGTIALRGHVVSADHMGSAHVGSLPAPSFRNVDEMLARMEVTKHGLYAHQRRAASIKGSAVLVAPTGSGKTEAALSWASTQSDNGICPPRLFYTLPYQASMNAMFDRLNDKLFAGLVGLEHSRSTLALYQRFLEENHSSQDAARAARWSKNLARLHYFPVRVLSPYQILKGPYRLKGYESLLNDFFNAAVVLDEIHAYEPERLAIILSTVTYLRENFGTHFFIMSATLPALLQARLANALGGHASIRASAELFSQFRRHRLILQDGDLLQKGALDRIAESARTGQSVLVCCNLVRRAQGAYRELADRLREDSVEIVLLHGRFNGADRLNKERSIVAATGSTSENRHPVVLVATQVVEVSLDIDLDVIYTDPAPLEALIQRFGRINRRRLKGTVPVYVFREPADGQRIYGVKLVQGTLNVLEKNNEQVIDEEGISRWLDEVYVGEIAEKWESAYDKAYQEFSRSVLRPLRAFHSDDSLEEVFYQAFDSIEVLPASLQNDYQRLIEATPIEASQLLVPIRWGQFAQLRAKRKVLETVPGFPKVVDADYNEFGLNL